jgi:hypothetical protein
MDRRLGGTLNVERRKVLPLSGLELRTLSHPTWSQLLYQLCYPGSYASHCIICLWNGSWAINSFGKLLYFFKKWDEQPDSWTFQKNNWQHECTTVTENMLWHLTSFFHFPARNMHMLAHYRNAVRYYQINILRAIMSLLYMTQPTPLWW